MRWPCLLLALPLGGCSDLVQAYNQEYVLYDASKAPPPAGTPAGDFARLREAENLLAEVDRAIANGLDGDGALAAGRALLEASIATQRTALGDQLAAMRAGRAEELRKQLKR